MPFFKRYCFNKHFQVTGSHMIPKIGYCKNAGMLKHCVSKLFQPRNIVPINAVVKSDPVTSKSQKLMIDAGIIRQASAGSFYLLPLGERALKKLIAIVDNEMENIGAQKLLLPLLTSGNLWKTTGRWDEAGAELFVIKDRHEKEFVLSPTHEEAITSLIATSPQLSYHQLPLLLYQITSKFRDEMKPRFGLLRGKEFIMKDLYTFDVDPRTAEETYDIVNNAYDSIFKKIGVSYVKVVGSTGVTGGSLSHEYHFPTDVGEDQLLICQSCHYGVNEEIYSNRNCPKCKRTEMESSRGIEVGHTFLLGTKYSAPLQATYLKADGKSQLMEMGSYGLGMSRILAASLESLSLPDEIRWPASLAPFSICIIPPKEGSKEYDVSHLAHNLYEKLHSINMFKDNVIIDDRNNLTIGKRIFYARKTGYPFLIVVGRKAMQSEPYFEVLNILNNDQMYLSSSGVIEYLSTQMNNPD